jgi:hypothetical protein
MGCVDVLSNRKSVRMKGRETSCSAAFAPAFCLLFPLPFFFLGSEP